MFARPPGAAYGLPCVISHALASFIHFQPFMREVRSIRKEIFTVGGEFAAVRGEMFMFKNEIFAVRSEVRTVTTEIPGVKTEIPDERSLSPVFRNDSLTVKLISQRATPISPGTGAITVHDTTHHR